MTPVVRWLLVPLTALAVWVGTLLIGIGASGLLDSLCPPELMVSGLCTAPWHRPAMAAVEMICAGIAAAGFIALPVRVAPAYRPQVAVACFVAGGLFTIQLAIAGAMWAPAVVAATVGVIVLGRTISRARACR